MSRLKQIPALMLAALAMAVSLDSQAAPEAARATHRPLQQESSPPIFRPARRNASQVIMVRRLATGTVFQLAWFGSWFVILPWCLIEGIMGIWMPNAGITWNGASLHGIKGLLLAPFIAVFGCIMALGLWVKSYIAPLEVEFYPTPEP